MPVTTPLSLVHLPHSAKAWPWSLPGYSCFAGSAPHFTVCQFLADAAPHRHMVCLGRGEAGRDAQDPVSYISVLVKTGESQAVLGCTFNPSTQAEVGRS